jgi:hypothetical protein
LNGIREILMFGDVYFYTTRNDVRGVLAELDESHPVQLVPVKPYSDPLDIVAYRLDELPNLGVALFGSELQEDRLLVMQAGTTVGSMRTEHADKTVSYDVVSSANPDSVIIWPAGEFGNDCLIRGHFRPSSDSLIAISLYRELKRLLKQRGVLANKHYLGQQALQRLQEGARLTHSFRAASSYDFRLPD